MNAPLSVSVSRLIPARPTVVYDLIADLPSMPRYSPETVDVRWSDGATGPAVGARFVGRNALGWARWSTRPTVTTADRGIELAFQVPGTGGPRWSYRFEAVHGGTLVTESMSQTEPSPLPIRLLQRWAGAGDRAAHLRAGMETTLERLAAAALDASSDPAAAHRTSR